MKFGKHLVTVVEEVHPDWSAAFLSYKSLKKILGRLESEGVQSLTAEEMHALEEEFCKVLVGEVNKMDKFFVDKEEDYIILLGHLSAQAKVLMEDDSNNRAANREAYTETERGLIELHAELVLLDNYSMLNYLALVKILKKHDKLTKAKLQDKFLAKIKKQPFWATRQLQRLIRNVKDTVENLQSSGAVVSSTEKPTLLDLPQLPDEPEDAEEEADGDAERAGGAKEACTVAEEADTSADKGAGRDEDDRDELVAGNVTATTMSRFVCALDAWQRQGFRGSSFNIRQSLTPSPMMGMRATELRGSSHAERPTTSDAHPDDASVEDATAQPAAKRPRVDNA